MTRTKARLVRHRRQATARRRRFPPVYSILGLLCIVLLFVTIVQAETSQTGDGDGCFNEESVVGSQPSQRPLGGEKDPNKSRCNRVAIIGGGIGGISVAHFLMNEDDQPHISQLTVFEKKPQFGGRIRFTQIHGHGTTINTAGHTFDADDMLIEEIANYTSISLQDWPHNEWNTGSRSLLYYMNKADREERPAEEMGYMSWVQLARFLRRNIADLSFGIRYLFSIYNSSMERGLSSRFNLWARQRAYHGKQSNSFPLAESQAKGSQSLELRRRLISSDGVNPKPQKALQWNQHDRILTGLLGDLHDHETFTTRLNSVVTRVTRNDNGTFGVHWIQDAEDGTQEVHMEQFDKVVIAAPFHQVALEIEPPLPLEPEKITYAPIHVTSIISERLADSLILQRFGEHWKTSAAFLWPTHLHHQDSDSNTNGLRFISVTSERVIYDTSMPTRADFTRISSGNLFSDDDLATLFNKAGEYIAFPNQSCFLPQQAHPDFVQPKYEKTREEFALEGGAVDTSSGCVDRPTIAWIHRDCWPNGIPVIKRDVWRRDDGVRSELAPGMFYLNGFEGVEGASVSKSIASARRVKDLLFA